VSVRPFTGLNFVGDSVQYVTEPGSTTSVDIRTFGKIDTSAIKISQKDGVLTVDSSKYNPHQDCHLVCPYGASNTQVVITTPEPWRVPMDSMRGAKLEYLMNAAIRNYTYL